MAPLPRDQNIQCNTAPFLYVGLRRLTRWVHAKAGLMQRSKQRARVKA